MASKKTRGKPKGDSGPRSRITLGSLTHVGMKRSGNEDSYCALVPPNSPPNIDMLLAVADGMGGHQAGGVASSLATRGLVELLSKAVARGTKPTGAHPRDDLLTQMVREINAQVHRAALEPETRGMGTTLTAALLAGSVLTIAHVGDSRAYLLRDGMLHQLTQDHSWVAEEVARGALTPEEARKHPRRNILTQALGMAPEVLPDSVRMEVSGDDVLLLCSDGLHSLVSDDEIARTLADEEPQEACRSLVERANALGGHDNITVVTARIDGLGTESAPSSSRLELHRMTTMALEAPPSSSRQKIARALGILLFPLWLPVWLPARLIRRLFGKKS